MEQASYFVVGVLSGSRWQDFSYHLDFESANETARELSNEDGQITAVFVRWRL